jgi:protein Mpv17
MNAMFNRSFQRIAKNVRHFSSKMNAAVQDNSVFATYNRYLTEKPLLTKSITSGVLSFLGDVACQKYFPEDKTKGEKVDWSRTLKFTVIGTVLVGPMLHYWYGFLCSKIPGTSITDLVKRVFFDQLVFAPFCIIPSIFSLSMIMDGTPEKIPEKLHAEWASTIIANWSLWVPCQFFNFKLVPPQFQVLFANVVGLFWNVYLSAATYKSLPAVAASSDTTNAAEANKK